MAGELNGTGRLPQIRVNLHPTPVQDQYQVQVEYTSIDGGWPAVFTLLLGALSAVANQVAPGKNVGESPVFRAMTGVFQEFMKGLVQAGEHGPLVERVTGMPPRLPSKEWFKN